jgi:hypothetical protein
MGYIMVLSPSHSSEVCLLPGYQVIFYDDCQIALESLYVNRSQYTSFPQPIANITRLRPIKTKLKQLL